ncbi:hypothetical protein HBA55_04375 [Pseudomaricurvus alkylphenolicus]|uniref:hydroxymethylglutaryl-CoA synthase family protein n=1 Tax=Pseudomaricurvus alkylphenolicus TaxID=1306991 RepID=UPI00142139C1|nr:3-oxoacyl-[acyl-carrier-protein] synthase III C-terminal domain-containing protein [Pseudomaricurvus alkylphenolicus]NIB38807.1 hypothetical protein [Pseudomaricurvus alkylphenolicus]
MQVKGISAYGAYVPSLRMSRKAIAQAHSWALPSLRGLGKGTRAFCSWDEDAITMAVESVRNCLKNGADGAAPIGALTFASTTAPFADYQNATSVAAATGLPSNIQASDASGSLRAGTSALLNALQNSRSESALIVASDCRLAKPGSVQEMHYGAGSAALAVGSDNIIARFVGSESNATQFADHYRRSGADHDYYWEERWVRDEGYMKIVPATVNTLLEKTGTPADAIQHFCMPGTLARLGAGLAKKLGINPEAVVDNFAADIGDTGSPQALLMLIAALEKASPGERILVVGFGAGCDALLLEATDAITEYQPAVPLSTVNDHARTVEHYNQLLSFSGQLQLDWGMRAEVDNKVSISQLYRSQDQVTGFNGGECSSCGAVQFPILSTCVKCGSTEPMSRKSLADESARVATYSSDNLQYYPAPPMYWGLVQFDNGARLLMEMVDVNAESFDVGTPLRMTYRIKQKDDSRGLHRYFWKATPF